MQSAGFKHSVTVWVLILLATFAQAQSSAIYLVNKSNKQVNFNCEDDLFEFNQIELNPRQAKIINSSKPFIIRQSNGYQNMYLLQPGDSVNIFSNKKGNAVLKWSNDSIRNEESSAITELNEKLTISFMKMGDYKSELLDVNYKKLDSIYKWDFNEKNELLDFVAKRKLKTTQLTESLRKFYQMLLLTRQLLIGTESKDKIEADYHQYLFGLQKEVYRLSSENSPFNISGKFLYIYQKYRFRKMEENNFFFWIAFITAL